MVGERAIGSSLRAFAFRHELFAPSHRQHDLRGAIERRNQLSLVRLQADESAQARSTMGYASYATMARGFGPGFDA